MIILIYFDNRKSTELSGRGVKATAAYVLIKQQENLIQVALVD